MQAARGTSVADSGRSAPVSALRARVVLGALFLVLYAADQVTKALAVEHLGRAPRELIGEVLQLRLVRNPGAAFSAGTAYTEVLSLVAACAVVVVLWLARRVRSPMWALALGLLLAGVAGNLTDRLLRAPGPLRGHVVDFLELPNWPIFNVADICINAAAVAILIQAFRGVRLDGSRSDTEPAPDQPADAGDEQARR